MNTTQLIYKVLSGNASEDEKLQLEQWKTSSDENRTQYEDIKMLWECSRDIGGDMSEEEYRKGWQEIKQRWHVIQKKRRRNRAIVVVIMMILALIILGWFVYQLGQQEKPSLYGYDIADPSCAHTCL